MFVALNIVTPLATEKQGEDGEESLRTNFEQVQAQLDSFMKRLVQVDAKSRPTAAEPAAATNLDDNDDDDDDGYIEVDATSGQQQTSNKRNKRSFRSDSNVSKKSEFDDIESLFEVSVDWKALESANFIVLIFLGIGGPTN